MAWFETWFKNDLAKPINVVQLQGVMFNLDNLANKIGVELEYNGQPAALEGTIAGYVIRNDGTTLNLTTNTGKDGNKAWVILPQEAYTVEGPISIVIKLVYNSAETTIGACAGYVTRSRTSSEIAPTGTVIPSLASLEAAIAAANAAAVNAADAVDYIAPTEEDSTASMAHAVGSYFIYNGKLMNATSAIAQGATIVPYASGVTSYNCAEVPNGLSGSVYNVNNTANAAANNAADAQRLVAKVESMAGMPTSAATMEHATGSYFVFGGVLYQATADIAIGDPIVTTGTGANAAQVPGGVMGEVEALSSDVTDLKSALDSFEEKTIETKLGKNLYNPETDVVGMLSSDGTINASQTVYLTSDFIKVEGSENYFFSIRSSASATTPVTTRHLSLVYDENKNIISNTYQNVNDTPGLSISIPANGAYIRVSVHYSTGYVMQVEKGSSMTTYEAYSKTLYLITKLGETPMNQITEDMDEIISEYNTEHEVPIIQTRQLFDRSLVEVGYSDTSGWINTGATGYVRTPKIDVSGHAGDTIYFSSDSVAKVARFITAYDSLGNAVPASGDNNGTSTPRPYTVPSGIASIVISYVNPSSDSSFNHFQAEYGKITGYAKYGSYFNIDTYLGKDNVLYGKKWVACGDSFTHGDFQYSTDNNTIQEGQYQGQLKVYPFLIGNRTGMNVINEAQNGSTMTHIAGRTNAFSDTRYTQIPSDADYITLKFGINDDSAHQNVPIGTIDDVTNETFYGAWNVVMSYLITHHLDAKIGIIITNGATLDIVNATIAIAEKWGVPYLNEATDKQCSFVFRSNRTDIPSAIRDAKNNNWYVNTTPGSVNLHPNAKAHEFESSVVEAWLRSL